MNKLFSKPRFSFLKFFVALGLAVVLFFGNSHSALAGRSGGRIGGGSFRAPTRSLPAPAPGGGYRSPGPGYYGGPGYGGGFGFPFLLPFFGFGGFGSLFTILIFFAVASFLFRAIGSIASGGGTTQGYGYGDSYDNPPVSIAKIQVGLLSSARELQAELNELAERADTGTAIGRAQVLQESTLALLRHPEYWVYGAAEAETTPLSSAEAHFNQWAIAERSKFSEETLSNVNSHLHQAALKPQLEGSDDRLATLDGSRNYILVTILAGIEGNLTLPAINDSQELRQALQTIAGIGSDRLLAIEVLWTPQAEGDTLTTEDILAAYPNLKLV